MTEYKPQTLQEQIEFTATGGRKYDMTRFSEADKLSVAQLHQTLANADTQGYLANAAIVPTPEESPLQAQIRTMLTGDRGYDGIHVQVADIATEDELKMALDLANLYQAEIRKALESDFAKRIARDNFLTDDVFIDHEIPYTRYIVPSELSDRRDKPTYISVERINSLQPINRFEDPRTSYRLDRKILDQN